MTVRAPTQKANRFRRSLADADGTASRPRPIINATASGTASTLKRLASLRQTTVGSFRIAEPNGTRPRMRRDATTISTDVSRRRVFAMSPSSPSSSAEL